MGALKIKFIGARLQNIDVKCFAKHGIPIPQYTNNVTFLLLFQDEEECRLYLKKLIIIKAEMENYDPEERNPKIQESITFISRVIFQLNSTL